MTKPAPPRTTTTGSDPSFDQRGRKIAQAPKLALVDATIAQILVVSLFA
jgi:hypothetical protein